MNPLTTKLHVKQKVRWKHAGQAHEGVVSAVIPPDVHPKDVIDRPAAITKLMGGWPPREGARPLESYLVEETIEGLGNVVLHWPKVAELEPVEEPKKAGLGRRILLIGRGHLGKFLRERLCIPDELLWTGDIRELSTEALREMHPDVVINTGAKTDLKWCQENPLAAADANLIQPLELWRRVKQIRPCPIFVHLSSGCFWEGPYREDGTPFENDPPRPTAWYGWTKATCDEMLLAERDEKPLVILRPRQVFSGVVAPRNTLMKLKEYESLINTPNTMTSCETIARTIERVMDPDGWRAFGRKIMVYDQGITSPYAVGVKLAGAGLRTQPKITSKSALDETLIPRRVDVVMLDEFFERFVPQTHVDDQLDHAIDALKVELECRRAIAS